MGYLGFLIVLISIGMFGGLIFQYISNKNNARIKLPYNKTAAALVFVLGLFLSVINKAVIQIPGGHVGVLYSFGAINKQELGEGLNFIVPFKDEVTIVDVRTKKQSVDSNTVSKDLQPIDSQTTLNYGISPQMAAELKATVSGDVGVTIIEPAMQEAIKYATAQYDIQNMVSNRDQVRDKAKQILVDKLTKYGVHISEYTITDFNPSKKYLDAVEAKQISEQTAQKAKFDLEKVQTDAQQKVAIAQAEAESLKAQRNEITAELLQLRQIENQKAAIEKWDGALPQNMYGSAPVPFLNLQQK